MGLAQLNEYLAKRKFDLTPEPRGGYPDAARTGWPCFVVQMHAARQLHYDLRLEWDGVLKSWAIPKGPSLQYGEKRYAAQTEDHPLAYADFEGTIPKGNYGAGAIIVWDRGVYLPDENPRLHPDERTAVEDEMRRGYASGKLSFTLYGRKLRGSFALVRLKEGDWLLLKHQDRYVTDRDILLRDESVLTGRRLQGDSLPLWRPSHAAAVSSPVPTQAGPMLASVGEGPFDDPGWVFEPKLDGFRILARIEEGQVSLRSRGGNDLSFAFPNIRQRLASLSIGSAVLDGELVALKPDGQASFERLLTRFQLRDAPRVLEAESSWPVQFYAFDLLGRDGYDLRPCPWEVRRAELERILADPPPDVHLTTVVPTHGTRAFAACVDAGFEGVVAKRRASAYTAKRSGDWKKLKREQTDEFLVCGLAVGQGWRAKTFGSLILGQVEEDGRLVYVGNVGSGFDDRDLVHLRDRLAPLQQEACPFAEVPAMKEPVSAWVRPEVVVEVKYDSWTDTQRLRAPVFLRIRPDHAGPSFDSHLLAALLQAPNDWQTEVEGFPIGFTNLDKHLWTADQGCRAFTKRDYATYCLRNQEALLRHLRNRPLTLTRYPNGHCQPSFYQKHWEGPLPPFVETVTIFSEHRGESGEYLMCNNLATLLWLVQIADLEIHTWYARVATPGDGLGHDYATSKDSLETSALNYPDFVVFDLDPYIYKGTEAHGAEPELNQRAFAATVDVAYALRDALVPLGLRPFVKTTGKTGLHVFVPIVRNLTYREAKRVAETLGQHLRTQMPDRVTLEWAVDKRTGKVFFDYNQNVRGKTLASVYSPRPTAGAKVSVPVTWEELDRIYPTDFDLETTPKRIDDIGDLWADILEARANIRTLIGG